MQQAGVREGEEVYRRATASEQATSIAYGNLQSTLFDQGKLLAQDSVATEMRRRFPTVPGLSLNVMPRLYQEGKSDSRLLLIRQERSSSDAQARIAAVSIQSDLAAVRGRLRESMQCVRSSRGSSRRARSAASAL